MSVNSYLEALASKLVVRGDENESIKTSIQTLQYRLNAHFGSKVIEHFRFGSSTRGTILPRRADSNSDIDYMVVFDTSKETLKPQSYLDRLRVFVQDRYSTSEIYQSSPTIVLNLNHIRFELVPAIKNWNTYQIPSPNSYFTDWLVTDPNGFNENLTRKNMTNDYQIKPLVRLGKYWNALNGHPYSTFDLESNVVNNMSFYVTNLKDYFYRYWEQFSYTYDTAQYIKDKVDSAKRRVQDIRKDEDGGYPIRAQSALEKLLPDL